MPDQPLTFRKIFLFWMPLAATWLMMAAEGPFIAAVIARMGDPKHNLAAYGVSFSLAVLVEAPILMIMGASTALVKDRDSMMRVKAFTYILNGILTLVMATLITPPVFSFVVKTLMNLPVEVAQLSYQCCLALIPWPAAIGYRRFYQGVLIRSNQTRRVAYGTMIRLVGMAATGILCFKLTELAGSLVGALALTAGVSVEAAASKVMARGSEKELLTKVVPSSKGGALTYADIARFYYPLALTSILGLGLQPILTFFIGHSRMAIESLAVLPVINSLVFIFRSAGLSYQEVGIALLGENNVHFRPLRDFAILVGTAVSFCFGLVAFTPLSSIWYSEISGLSQELYQLALLPTRILTMMPGLMILLSLQRSLLVNHMQTQPINIASAIEVAGAILALLLTIRGFDLIGADAAAISLLLGRVLATAYLFLPFARILRIPR
jgi:progressive ankylosis protein